MSSRERILPSCFSRVSFLFYLLSLLFVFSLFFRHGKRRHRFELRVQSLYKLISIRLCDGFIPRAGINYARHKISASWILVSLISADSHDTCTTYLSHFDVVRHVAQKKKNPSLLLLPRRVFQDRLHRHVNSHDNPSRIFHINPASFVELEGSMKNFTMNIILTIVLPCRFVLILRFEETSSSVISYLIISIFHLNI